MSSLVEVGENFLEEETGRLCLGRSAGRGHLGWATGRRVEVCVRGWGWAFLAGEAVGKGWEW